MARARGEEARRHPRLPVALRVHFGDEKAEVLATTRTASREGFDVRLPQTPGLGERLPFALALPGGARVRGVAECRSRGAGGLCGFSLFLPPEDESAWVSFLEEEESTGSLWRLVARWARGRGEERHATRTVTARGRFGSLFGKRARPAEEVALRFHMVGENGEAYRICFERHPSSPASQCDLAERSEGFRALAERAITRVLDEPVHVRLFEDGEPMAVRVCELARGGFAWVQGELGSASAATAPVGLVSLAVGEVILLDIDHEPVFPYFSSDDLERIACDTFRNDLQRPMFTPSGKNRAAPGPLAAPAGIRGVADAQLQASLVQRRRYGEREIDLFPEVWARAVDEAGHEVLGPTMRDGERALLLALVGTGAPRVVRLQSASDVSLLGRRR